MKLKTMIIALFLASNIALYPYAKYELYCNRELLELSREIALTQEGVTEAGHNRGEVEKYLRIFDARGGIPYCAAGVYWCFYRAAINLNLEMDSIPIPKTMVADNIFLYAVKHGEPSLYSAKLDDLIVWRRRSNYRGHIERIIEVGEKGNVRTIAFNSSIQSRLPHHRNGRKIEGVFIKRRNIYHPLSNLFVRGLIGFRTDKT